MSAESSGATRVCQCKVGPILPPIGRAAARDKSADVLACPHPGSRRRRLPAAAPAAQTPGSPHARRSPQRQLRRRRRHRHRRGRALRDRTHARDFQVFEDGAPQTIETFSYIESPPRTAATASSSGRPTVSPTCGRTATPRRAASTCSCSTTSTSPAAPVVRPEERARVRRAATSARTISPPSSLPAVAGNGPRSSPTILLSF